MGRRSSRGGASSLHPQSCSTPTARLCRIIKRLGSWWFGLNPPKSEA
jgi:hypothetical protein